MSKDGCYLVNCTKDNQRRSAVAYYNTIEFEPNHNVNEQPNAFVYIPGDNFVDWEGKQQSVTFSSGVKFTWNVEGNAQAQATGAVVGSADNSFEDWKVFKDTGRYLVVNGDGFTCNVIYFVN